MRWCNSSISDSLGDFCVLSADRFVKCIRKFTVDLFRTWNLLIHMALLSLLFRFATAKWTKLPLTNVSYRYISADSGLWDVRKCMEVFFDPHHNITISYILHCRGSVHCGRRVLFPFDLLRYVPNNFPAERWVTQNYYTELLGLEYKSRVFSLKLRPGELLHGHNSVNSQQILMGLQGTLPISLDRVYPKYQNDW